MQNETAIETGNTTLRGEPRRAQRSLRPLRGIIVLLLMATIGNAQGAVPAPEAREEPTGRAAGSDATRKTRIAQKQGAAVSTGGLSYTDNPWGTRIFQQRACNGIDDCVEANIELERTETSRLVNRLSRTSPRQAIALLGAPSYVLRSGDKVQGEYYDGYPTEHGLAQAIVLWENGACAPNALHVRSENGRLLLSIETGGSECTIDGKPFPMPGPKFSCRGGRSTDALCSVKAILKLPGWL